MKNLIFVPTFAFLAYFFVTFVFSIGNTIEAFLISIIGS